MKISILDDYHDTVRSLPCFEKLKGHNVRIWTDHVEDVDVLVERLKDTEALVPPIQCQTWVLRRKRLSL
jgi:D-3-phosphoglycerate dehydrogenase